MPIPVTSIDRAEIPVRADLAETISNYLGNEEIVQVEDSRKPPGRRLRYTIQWTGGVGHVFDRLSHSLGVFADLDALVAHAENATA